MRRKVIAIEVYDNVLKKVTQRIAVNGSNPATVDKAEGQLWLRLNTTRFSTRRIYESLKEKQS